MTTTGPRSTRLPPLLIALAAVLLWLTTVVIGTERGILRPDVFSRRLAATLENEYVANYVAGRITDGIVAQRPNLIGVRPMIQSGVRAVVATASFRAVVRSTARALHHSLFEAGGKQVVLSLPDVSVLVRGALAQASPELAAKIPPGIETKLASPGAERAFSRFIAAWALAEQVLWGAWAMFGLGVLLLVAAIWVAPDRAHTLVRAGSALLAVGLALAAILPAGRIVAAAITHDAELRGVLHGLWRAYFGAVRPAAVVFGGAGVVLIAAGSTVLEAVNPLLRAQALWRWLSAPLHTAGQTGRAALLVAAGTYALVAPAQGAALLVAGAGLLLVFLGVREVFRLVLASVPVRIGAGAPASGARVWPIMAVTGAAVLAALGGGALLVMRAPEAPPEAEGVVTACNGSPALCDRRLDQVVFPGAHNAMSNAEIPGWMFPHHHYGFPRQLADGIRALAIDVHYGVPAGDRVVTDFDREHSSQQKIEEVLGPEATAAALRIRERLVGQANGPSGLYFCHGFCELGAYPVVPALEGVRDFLLANAGEVVVVVVEDYVPPEELARAFEEAGLVRFVYTGPMSGRLPTLRTLIEEDQRLVVFIESGKPGVAWLHPTIGTFQETPYSFHRPQDFSCRPNRGGTEGALFLINHWIETTPAPRPTNADTVNAYSFLLRRARECAAQRHHLPNVISVDFYDVGDVLRVARKLNGLDTAAARAPGADSLTP